MLDGIDISHHQGDINLSPMQLDFVICKATEATAHVDTRWREYAKQVLGSGKLLGLYHFANKYDPIDECEHFLETTIDYRGIAVPALDWEGVYEGGKLIYKQSVDWVNRFVSHYHENTGIWPWIYSNPSWFLQGGVEKNCGRWAAKWPNVLNPGLDYNPSPIPDCDGLVCCWQYASDGRVAGYSGNLDVNHFYGDVEAWRKYAKAGYVGEIVTPSTDTSVLENDEYRITVERKQ